MIFLFVIIGLIVVGFAWTILSVVLGLTFSLIGFLFKIILPIVLVLAIIGGVVLFI